MLRSVARWAGVWTGQASFNETATALMRNEICPILEGRAVSMDFEVYEPAGMQLVYGVRTVLAPDLDGSLKTLSFSTRFGLVQLEQTPDDQDVLALTGVTDEGVKLTVTMLPQDRDHMQLSAIWRPVGAGAASEEVQGVNGLLRRVTIWKPGAPMPDVARR